MLFNNLTHLLVEVIGEQDVLTFDLTLQLLDKLFLVEVCLVKLSDFGDKSVIFGFFPSQQLFEVKDILIRLRDL